MEFQRTVTSRRRGLNLTSLIDVVFLLVIFFMLTSKYMMYELVRLHLSTVESTVTGKAVDSRSVLLITLAPEGVFVMDRVTYSADQLLKKIRPLILADTAKKLSIVLAPKKTITVQEVMTAMQQLKMAGVQNISLVE